MLFLYSDALTESVDDDGGYFQRKDIIREMKSHLAEITPFDPALVFNRFIEDFSARYGAKIADDLTLNAYYRL